jgi:hypothetical protein
MEVHLPAYGDDGVSFRVLDYADLEFRADSPLSRVHARRPMDINASSGPGKLRYWSGSSERVNLRCVRFQASGFRYQVFLGEA